MRIVLGRGKRRVEYDLPCADIVKRGSEKDQRVFTDNVSAILGIIASKPVSLAKKEPIK